MAILNSFFSKKNKDILANTTRFLKGFGNFLKIDAIYFQIDFKMRFSLI